MPEMKRFVVTETREVEVVANDIVAAVRVASQAFRHGQGADLQPLVQVDGDIWGAPTNRQRVTDIQAREPY